MTHKHSDQTAHGVIARGFCAWDPDEYADFEGDDLADVALRVLDVAGYVITRKTEEN
jgi:hypothetical protein